MYGEQKVGYATGGGIQAAQSTRLGQDVRASEVEEQVGSIGSQLDVFEKELSRLCDRVAAVSRGTPPEAPAKASAPEQVLVPLAGRLRNHSQHLGSLLTRLANLTDSLEL